MKKEYNPTKVEFKYVIYGLLMSTLSLAFIIGIFVGLKYLLNL